MNSSPHAKTELTYIGLIGSGILLLAFCVLAVNWRWDYASQWLLTASCIWALVLWQTWQRLDRNRPDAESPPYPTLGFANQLTLLRGGLIALTSGFLFLPMGEGFLTWIPGLLYGAAAVLDRIDGFVARKSKRTSLLGSDLDTLFDALGLVVAPLLAVCYGKAHWTFLAISIAYYLFQWGLYWRRRRGLVIHPLMPSQLRRTLAGFQMGFVALLLMPCFKSPLTQLLALVFMLPMLLGFIVDWLIVSDKINGQSPTTQSFFNRLANFNTWILLPGSRLSLCVLLVSGIFLPLQVLHSQFLNSLPLFQLSSLIFFAALILIGFLARLGALGILLILSIEIGSQYPDVITSLILLCATAILLLGPGHFSVWQADDVWVNRHDGAAT